MVRINPLVTSSPFIHLAGVRKVYGEHLAISDASFDVMPGELVSLVGPSGCGKSTLLKVLAGLHPHDGGEVRIGSPSHPFDPSKDVGMVFQAPLLLKWRRILENVLLPAEILGLPMAQSKSRARDLLALVGLAGFEDKYPYELSGGMQQRAAIARALIHDPKLILMDEPFGALDALTREKMNLELLRIWSEARKTIVFVTHDISKAVAGGGLSTLEDPRHPGFLHNTHAFFQRAITLMPWYADLELARRGAHYIEPELNVALLTGDGRALEWWTDIARTIASFGEFSARDAGTLRRWHDEFVPIVQDILTWESRSPPLPPEERRGLLQRSAAGRRLLAVSALSPIEFVSQEFEHPTVQAGV